MSAWESHVATDPDRDEISAKNACRIMLVADGEPQHRNLSPLTYGHESRSVADGLYRRQRERVIIDAVESAKQCGSWRTVYIMTTGYGAVPFDAVLNIYNVPGQFSIQRQEYRDKYKASLRNILQTLPQSVQRVSIVYYAAISKQAFREGIFDILLEISLKPDVPNISEVRACMYGDRFHLARRWKILCEVFDALEIHDDSSLDRLRQSWLTQHGTIAPFFDWF